MQFNRISARFPSTLDEVEKKILGKMIYKGKFEF